MGGWKVKVCTKCKIEKQKTEFSKDSHKKCGLRSDCKACVSEYNNSKKETVAAFRAEYRADNRERINARMAEYYKINAERINARNAEHYKANAERINAMKAEYRAENRENIAAQAAKYRAANPDKFVAWHAAWVAANPDKKAASNRNRRAIKRSAEGRHTATDVRAIFEKQQGLCANCETKLFKSGKQRYHVDHIMPLALGGSNWPCNLQCLCPACNLSKGAKHPDEWVKQQGKTL